MIGSIFLQIGEGAGQWSTLIMFGGMFIIFFFFIIRPQMKKQKQEKTFQQDLKRGEFVVTTSGIHGKIFEISDDTVVIETSAGKIKFEKSAISREITAARYKSETKE